MKFLRKPPTALLVRGLLCVQVPRSFLVTVLSRVRRVGAIAASIGVAFALVALAGLVWSIGLLSGIATLWSTGALLVLMTLGLLCLLVALSASASQRGASRASSDYAAVADANFVSMPARLSMASKPGLSTALE